MNEQKNLNSLLEEAKNISVFHQKTIHDLIPQYIYQNAENISSEVVCQTNDKKKDWDRAIDNILTSSVWGYPIMLALLMGVFWITITGANYPSAMLASGFFWLEERLLAFFIGIHSPEWLYGFLVLGVYKGLAWVVSVMLPPMAIFFPLFTFLEDLGYLPRVAFNVDRFFKKAGTHGKQALTMCMGFGCNAAGIISCRIIDSPREKLIAILTNNFVPCNGRFPTLIALATIFFGGSTILSFSGAAATLTVVGLVILGIAITLLVSWLLSRTILKGEPSSFHLELPPYRKPQIWQVITRSVLDRTLFVLARAVVVAVPAGGIVWLLANTMSGDMSLLAIIASWLDGFARQLGMDGFILLAFILGMPANEIVFPILIMSYLSGSTMMELASLSDLRNLLLANGWTWLTASCTMLFMLCHWPCATTLITIQKEQHNWHWTLLAAIIPTFIGFILCFTINCLVR